MTEARVNTGADLAYQGDPGSCDVCGRPLDDEAFFCEAALPAHGGRWGVLCGPCTVAEGIRPGWGRAQFYERQAAVSSSGSAPNQLLWRCVAGQPPAGALTE